MKLRTTTKLCVIGLSNLLIFALIPPLLSLPSRFIKYSQTDEIVSALDIPKNVLSFNNSIILWLLSGLTIACFVGYINFTVVKKTLSSHKKSVKVYHALIPFGCWVASFALMLFSGLWRFYVVFITNDNGSLFGGSYVSLGYLFILVLNGLVVLSSSLVANSFFKHNIKTK